MEQLSLGEKLVVILRKRKTIKEVFLQEIRNESAQTGKPLEQLLVERNIVTPAEMTIAVAEYLKMPPISVAHFTPETKLLDILPKEMLTRHKIVPLTRKGKMLTLALADPFNIVCIEEVHALTKLDVVPVVAPEQEVTEFLQRNVQDEAAALEEVIRDMDDSDVEVSREDLADISMEEMLERAGDAPVIRVVNTLLIEGIRKHASDVHVEPMERTIRVRYRIDGILYDSASPPKSVQAAVISRVKIMANLNISERRSPQDGRFKMRVLGRDCDVRVSILPTVHGEKIVLRLLDKSSLMPSLSALGLDEKSYQNMRYAVEQPHGMILVTGPSGCGKTTTLYSAVQDLNKSDVNLVTIEDPVEYELGGINQVQIHPEVGLTFAVGLRSILRQSPDIVMVGEIRDDETATIAVQAALTGHLVLTSLHTTDAAGAVARMLYMGVDALMLSSSLVAAQSQRLYRKLCPHCKKERELPVDILRLNKIDPEIFPGVTFYQAIGCPKCFHTGYRGRGALMEVLLADMEMRLMILKETNASAIHKLAVKNGMTTLREAGLARVREGLTSIEEVLMVTGAD